MTTRRRLVHSLFSLAVLAIAVPSSAQVTGSGLIESQLGNFPNSDPDNRQDHYAQINLDYLFPAGRVGGRFETNRASEEGLAVPYQGFTLRYLDLAESRYRLRIGNFYTILGRGLIHRSFELNGVVLDQPGLRSRYAPSRDVDGLLAEATWGPIATKLLSGSPAGGDQSLGAIEFLNGERHLGQIAGGQLSAVVYRDAKVGVAFLHSAFGGNDRELGSGFVDLDPLRVLGMDSASLPLYFEYAQIDRSLSRWWDVRTQDRVPHALYASANLLAGPLGFSAEWKDYSQFRLGTNDPPSLIREHGAALLNRSTHILDAEREEGFQLEANWRAGEATTLTANWSRADGKSGNRFDEHYIELHVGPNGGSPWEATAFYDGGKDETVLPAIVERWTTGLATTVEFVGPYSATLDVQLQRAEHEAVEIETPSGLAIQPVRFEDIYLSLAVARAEWGSLSLVWQRTSDPIDLSRANQRDTKPLHMVSAVMGARLSERHQATFTAGQRRGGIACTAGTCYEVQPFEGVELRLISRF